MSFKLIFPSVGLVGSVSVAIISAFSAPSTKKSSINASSARKAQDVKSLEVTLRCSQNSNGWEREREYYTFKIIGEVKGKDAEELMEKKMVDIGVDLEIKSGEDWRAIEKFTRLDSEQVYMTVQYWNQKGLNVKLNYSGNVGTLNFWCKEESNPIDWSPSSNGDTFIFFTEVDSLGRKTLMKQGVDGAQVRVSLDDCQPENQEGKMTACSLKIGDVSDNNKWIVKVPEKTKFRFSK